MNDAAPPASPRGPTPILRARGVSVERPARAGHRPEDPSDPADEVDAVDLDLYPGETFGLLGESSSGAGALARALLGLRPISAGEVQLLGYRLPARHPGDLKALRCHAQFIGRSAAETLEPGRCIADAVRTGLDLQGIGSAHERDQRAVEMLLLVGLSGRHALCWPHQLTAEERLRVALARALALRPQLLVCEEPAAALDWPARARVLHLLRSLKRQLNMTMLWVSDDRGVLQQGADRVAVMHAGRVVEVGPRDAVFHAPRHPYTRSLLMKDRVLPRGQALPRDWPAPPRDSGGGCRHADACAQALPRCHGQRPRLQPRSAEHRVTIWLTGMPQHEVACWAMASAGGAMG